MHGLPEWTQVSIFYNFVNTPTRMMLDASANDTILDKPPREGFQILNKLAHYDYHHPTTRRGTITRGINRDEDEKLASNLEVFGNSSRTICTNLNKRPLGGFPSDTEVAKGATHEHCKAFMTRRGKQLREI
ncbi:hypothetical protein GQ457_02G024720 [Hibiscus cannabinus]